jgi:hypothetical protein
MGQRELLGFSNSSHTRFFDQSSNDTMVALFSSTSNGELTKELAGVLFRGWGYL